jgi:hypothetical protein
MTVNADNARIWGSDLDAIYLAPLGTTVPTTIDGPLDEEFEDVGWLNTDGIAESATGSVEKSRGYQGNAVVRTRVNEPGTTYAFTALETKPQTNALRYNEKAVDTSVEGVRKVTRGNGQKVSRRTAVIEKYDTDNTTIKERTVIPVFEITPNGDKTATATEISGYPFTGEIIGDYTSFETITDAEGN